MKFWIALGAVLIVGTVSCASKFDDEKKRETQITQQAESNAVVMMPPFEMTDVNGHTVNMASFKGKKVFVNLWATWCPPCRTEIPSIENLATKVDKDKAVFIMLSLDKKFEVAKKFAKKTNMQVPVYHAGEGLPALFKTEGIPTTFIFNEMGELVKTINGADDYDTDIYYRLLSQ